jgi:anhydro-N-acetylmuramic acid kinase
MINEIVGIGLMSGTSLDGVDICTVKFTIEKEDWNFEILTAETVAYSNKLVHQLQNPYQLSGIELTELDHELGTFYGNLCLQHIKKHNLSSKVKFIASHGHTIYHNPNKGYTLQIGAPEKIFNITGIKTIADFRVADVAFNGNGAPLVPIGDLELFRKYKGCINIGGFANITVKQKHDVFAFDICPTNTIINSLIKKLNPNVDYDDQGETGRTGNIIKSLFEELNNLSYYHLSHPKSLAIEYNDSFINPILKEHLKTNKIVDVLHTFYKHSAFQIAQNLNLNFKVGDDILITGGGAYNTFLIEEIKKNTNINIHIPEKNIVEYKEALIFAFLGLKKLQQKPNTLSSVTGADRDLCSGIIYDF